MRKMHKKQAEDFVKLLSQAHLEIKNALERKKFDIAMNLLEQCQEGAIELGHMIEESEGEGFTAFWKIIANSSIRFMKLFGIISLSMPIKPAESLRKL